MRPGQWERGHRAVVEFRVQPRSCRMALRAGLGESKTHVVGVFGIREIGLVATYAVRWRALEVAAHVTCDAVQRSVCAG